MIDFTEGEIGNKFSQSERSAAKAAKEKFRELAPFCRDRIAATHDDVVCTYHESSPTDCRFSICPRLELPLNEAASHLEKTEGRRR